MVVIIEKKNISNSDNRIKHFKSEQLHLKVSCFGGGTHERYFIVRFIYRPKILSYDQVLVKLYIWLTFYRTIINETRVKY